MERTVLCPALRWSILGKTVDFQVVTCPERLHFTVSVWLQSDCRDGLPSLVGTYTDCLLSTTCRTQTSNLFLKVKRWQPADLSKYFEVIWAHRCIKITPVNEVPFHLSLYHTAVLTCTSSVNDSETSPFKHIYNLHIFLMVSYIYEI